jgi:hypothetical protein
MLILLLVMLFALFAVCGYRIYRLEHRIKNIRRWWVEDHTILVECQAQLGHIALKLRSIREEMEAEVQRESSTLVDSRHYLNCLAHLENTITGGV